MLAEGIQSKPSERNNCEKRTLSCYNAVVAVEGQPQQREPSVENECD